MKCKNTNFSRGVVFLRSPRPLPLSPRFPSPPIPGARPSPRCQTPALPPSRRPRRSSRRSSPRPRALPAALRAPPPRPTCRDPANGRSARADPDQETCGGVMDAAIHPGGRSEQGLGFFSPPTWIPAEKSVPVRLWVLSSPLPAQVCPRPWGSWSPGLSADFLSIQASGDPPGVRGLPGEGRTLGPRGRPWLFILTPEQNEGGLQTRFFRPLIPHQHPAHPPSCWGWGGPCFAKPAWSRTGRVGGMDR